VTKITFLVPDITLKGGVERFVANSCSALSSQNKIEIISIFKSNTSILYDIPSEIKITYLSKLRFAWHYRISSIWLLMWNKSYINNNSDVIISTSPYIAIILTFLIDVLE